MKDDGNVTVENVVQKLGVWPKHLKHVGVNVAEAIVTDEFYRPHPRDKKHDYRGDALDRLTKLPYRWASEENLGFEIMKRYIKVVCPRCGGKTETGNGGGSGNEHTLTYNCNDCEQRVNLTLPLAGFEVHEYPEGLIETDEA